jgi:hypothetical protein
MIQTRKYQVALAGHTYTLLSDEPETDVLSAIQLAQETLKQLTDAGVNEPQKLALLATVQLAVAKVQLEHKVTAHLDSEARLMKLFAQVEL